MINNLTLNDEICYISKQKKVHFEILLQEVGGADLSKLAVESKALEMQYSALYPVIAKMNETSLLNYMK